MSSLTGSRFKVKDSTGTINYVAVGTTTTNSVIDADEGTVQAGYVVGKAANAGSTVYYGSETESLRGAGMSYNVRLNNDSLATT